MAELGQVQWILDVDTSSGEAKLRKFRGDVKSFSDEVENSGKSSFRSFSKNAAAGLNSVADSIGQVLKGAIALGVTGSVGIGAMTKAAFDQVRQVENAAFALRAYEKDAGKVNDVLGDLVAYARSDMGVLFQRQDLFAAASTLRAYGESADTVTDRVKILSRGVALGTTTFQELSLIVGRAAQSGKLTAEAYDQLAYRGIVLDSSLRGAEVSANDLYSALSNTLPASLLEGRANTIDGVLIRLQSAFRDLGSSILGVDRNTSQFIEGGAGDRFVDLMIGLTNTMKQPEVKQAFADLGKQLADLAERTIPKLIDGIIFAAENFDTILGIIQGLTAAFVALKVAALGLQAASTVAGVFNGIAKAVSAAQVAATGFNIVMSGGNIAATTSVLAKVGAAFGTLVTAISGAMGTITTIISVGARAIGAAIFSIPVVGWILLAITTLVGLFTYFYTTSEEFRNFVDGLFRGIGDGITKAFNDVGSFFAGVWSDIQKGLENVGKFFDDVWNGATKAVDDAGKAIYGVYESTLKPFVDGMMYLINAFLTIWTTVWGAIGQIAYTIISTLVQIIGVILQGTIMWLWNNVLVPFGQFFGELWQGFIDDVVSAVNAIGAAITEKWNEIVAFLTPAVETIKTFITTAFNVIRDTVIDAWNNIVSVVQPIVIGFVNFFNERISELVGFMNRAFNLINQYIVQPISKAVGYVGEQIGRIVGFIGDAIGRAVDQVRRWANDFINAGRNLIDGLVRGVQNGAGSVVQTVKDICANALDSVKKFFGIHSPSRVMAQQGNFLMEGLANGIESSGREVVSAVRDVNAAIANEMASSATSMNGEVVGRLETANSATSIADDLYGGATSGTAVTVNQSNTFYNADEPNMEKVNDDLAWQLNRL